MQIALFKHKLKYHNNIKNNYNNNNQTTTMDAHNETMLWALNKISKNLSIKDNRPAQNHIKEAQSKLALDYRKKNSDSNEGNMQVFSDHFKVDGRELETIMDVDELSRICTIL